MTHSFAVTAVALTLYLYVGMAHTFKSHKTVYRPEADSRSAARNWLSCAFMKKRRHGVYKTQHKIHVHECMQYHLPRHMDAVTRLCCITSVHLVHSHPAARAELQPFKGSASLKGCPALCFESSSKLVSQVQLSASPNRHKWLGRTSQAPASRIKAPSVCSSIDVHCHLASK